MYAGTHTDILYAKRGCVRVCIYGISYATLVAEWTEGGSPIPGLSDLWPTGYHNIARNSCK